MGRERRFGRRIAEPSSVQIVHELKLMALRQSLDAATAREASESAREAAESAREAAESPAVSPAGQPHRHVRVRDAAPSDPA